VPVGASIVERDKPTFVLGMNICTLLEKQLHHTHSVVASSKMERGRLKADAS
jgi:hypothetical protein